MSYAAGTKTEHTKLTIILRNTTKEYADDGLPFFFVCGKLIKGNTLILTRIIMVLKRLDYFLKQPSCLESNDTGQNKMEEFSTAFCERMPYFLFAERHSIRRIIWRRLQMDLFCSPNLCLISDSLTSKLSNAVVASTFFHKPTHHAGILKCTVFKQDKFPFIKFGGDLGSPYAESQSRAKYWHQPRP
ncbi:MAG: hypothetical protein JRI36_06730 [Deltaproteobacteria bacterium]|nr:hypothetical protein [Deltaproteobacteria bacterium]